MKLTNWMVASNIFGSVLILNALNKFFVVDVPDDIVLVTGIIIGSLICFKIAKEEK